jgi:hypothetical protein
MTDYKAYGSIAKRLCTGLQIRVGRFDSGSSLQLNQQLSPDWGFFVRVLLGLVQRSSNKG